MSSNSDYPYLHGYSKLFPISSKVEFGLDWMRELSTPLSSLVEWYQQSRQMKIEALLAPWSRKYTTIYLPQKVFELTTCQALVQIMSQISSPCTKLLGAIRVAILCKTRSGNNYVYYCIRSRLHAHRIRIASLLMGSLGWT